MDVRQGEEVLGQSVQTPNKSSIADRVIFVFCGIGLNITFAVYLAYVDVYGTQLQSKQIFGWMNLAIYTCAASVVMLQSYVDPIVDVRIGARLSFTLRVCIGLFAMALVLAYIPFATSKATVLLFGCMIGIFEGSGLTTLSQLAAAIDQGEMTKYVNTGFTLAQLVTILLCSTLGAGTSKDEHSAILFTWIPSFALLAIAVSFQIRVAWSTSASRFAKVFDKLERASLRAVDSRASGSNVEGTLMTQWKKPEGMVLGCYGVQFSTHFLSMFLMPFATYFGNLALARQVVLIRFASEFAGRIASHSSKHGPSYFNGSPFGVLVGLTALRLFVAAALIYHAFSASRMTAGQITTSQNLVEWAIALVYFLGAYVHSQVTALTVYTVPQGQQSAVARALMFLCFAAQLLALLAAVPIVHGLLAGQVDHKPELAESLLIY